MPALNCEEFERWSRLRRQTLVIFVTQTFLVGLDVSLTYLTLWMYLKEMVNPDNPSFYYSLIFVSFFIPSISLTGVVSNYIDKTRNVRLSFFIINTMVIVGNLLYVIPFSPWFLVIGRFLAGTGNSLRSVMSSEIARSYPVNVLSNKLCYLGFAYSMGYVGGPGINFIFKNVKFSIHGVDVNYLNIPGLYMALLFAILQFFSIFFLSDLSKIYDMKASLTEANLKKDELIGKAHENSTQEFLSPNTIQETSCLLPSNNSKQLNSIEKLRRMFSHFDITLIVILSFFQNYLESCYYMWCPLIVIERIHWSINALGWINISVGTMTIIPCIFLIVRPVSNSVLFNIGLLTQGALIVCQILLSVLYYENSVFVADIVMWGVYCLMWVVLVVGEELFLVGILAQLVSSEYQTFTDGIRLTFYRGGAVAAFVLSTLAFKQMCVVGFVHVVIVICCFVALIRRRKLLRNPKIIM